MENVQPDLPRSERPNRLPYHPFTSSGKGLRELVKYEGKYYPNYDHDLLKYPFLNAIDIQKRYMDELEDEMKEELNDRYGFGGLETLFEVYDKDAYRYIDDYYYDRYANMIDRGEYLTDEQKRDLKKFLKERNKAYKDLLNRDLSPYERRYIEGGIKPRDRNDPPPPPSDDLTMEDLPKMEDLQRGMGDRSYGMDRMNKEMRMYLLSDRKDENMDSYIRRILINTDGEQLSHIFFSQGIIPRVMKRLMTLDLPPNVLSEIKRRAVENAISYNYPLEEYDIPPRDLIDILRAEYNDITTSDAWSRERAQRIINTINRVGLEEFIYPRRDRFGIPR
jgi:hypothetical protein